MKFIKNRKTRRKILALLLVVLLLLTSVRIWAFIFPSSTQAATLAWKFDEGYSTTAGDTSGNSNSGTITNATWQTSDLCRASKCLYFDGTGDYVSRADDADLDFVAADDFTIMGWIRHPAIATNPDYVIAKHESGTAGGYKVYMDSDGDIVFAIDDDGTWDPEDIIGDDQSKNYDDNRWHHFAAVKDGTTGIYLYVDGVLIDSDTSLTASGTLANSASFYVGIDADGSSNGWSGFIDEVRVHRELRSASQIEADYLAGAPEQGAAASFGIKDEAYLSDGLLGYWRLDESSGTAADASGNALTLTNNNVTTYLAGKFGNGSEHVPASSQYLSTATTITGAKSVSFWVNPDSNTNYYISLTSGAYITSSSGTLSTTGFTSPTIYVNGNISSTITADTWSLVTVTAQTGIDADTFYIGRQGSNYFDGTMDEVRLYNKTLSPSEIKSIYNWGPEPIAYWDFDENTGSSLFDKSTRGNIGTLNGSMTESDWITGKYGSALDFDGTDDYVNVYNSNLATDFSGTSGTISAWIKVPVSVYSDNTTRRAIYLSADDSNSVSIYKNTSNQLTLQYEAGATIESYNLATSPTDWTHLAIVWSFQDNKVSYYINGKFVETDTTLGTWSGSLSSTRSNIAEQTTTSSQEWLGQIDEMRIYNYPRTAKQVIEDMNGGHPVGGSPIGSETVHWKLDEQYGATANDEIGNSNGTRTNATWLTTESGSCKVNGCLNFDASGEVVTIATASDSFVDFNGSEAFSASAWIYVTTMPTSTGSDKDAIIAKWDDTNNQAMYRIYVENDDTDTTGNIEVQVYDESASQALTATSTTDGISQNTWYHVVFTFNGGIAGAAGDLNLYLDGQNFSNSANASFAGIEDLASDFTVGEYDTNDATGGNTAFTGYIDEVKVYSAEISAEEVLIDKNYGSVSSFSVLGSRESANTVGGSGNPPTGYWTFDENTDNTCTGGVNDVCDRSGNGNDGAINGNPQWTKGKFGSALTFDGTGDYVNLGAIATPNTTTAYTISSWFYPTKSGGDDIIYCANAGSSFCWYTESNLELVVCSDGGGCVNNASSTANAVTLNTWQYVTLTYNGTDTYNFYVNGVNVTSDSSAPETSTAADELYIGLFPSDLGNIYLNGKIDEFKIYNYVRTQDQINYDYNRGKPLGWWKFDECTGTVANDSGSGGNNGTITEPGTGSNNAGVGTCSASAATMWNGGATGKFNGSLEFDGTDDEVTVGDTTNLRFDSGSLDFSISTWVKRNASGTTHYILSKEDADNDGYRLQFDSGNTVTCSVDSIDITSSSIITDTNWHHIVCVIDRDGNGQIYIDGNPDGSATAISSEPMATTTDIHFGTRSYTSANYLNGQIDDTRIYNYVLSANQIKNIMTQGAASFRPATGSP